jgi:hypothetical protein
MCLQGDATYLIVTDDGKIENYGLNAVCTHLGCVVPWNKAENKFMCVPLLVTTRCTLLAQSHCHANSWRGRQRA